MGSSEAADVQGLDAVLHDGLEAWEEGADVVLMVGTLD